MRILITGALGRIGEHLTAYLGKDHEVLGCDLLIGYNDGYQRMDVTRKEDVDEALSIFKPDLAIHMAGEVGRIQGEEHPERLLRTNIIGALNLSKACAEKNVRLINFSTSEVYGDSFDWGIPMHETATLDALSTSNLYALSKLMAEGVVKHYVANYKLQAITVRPFMIYGEGETPNPYRSALTNFVWAALNNKPFKVHKGTSRSWCHVSDFCTGLSLLLDYWNGEYEAFNIGSEEYHSMERTAQMVCEATDASESLIQLIDYPDKLGSKIKVASIEKIKRLGYQPKVSLQEGIKRVRDWQRSSLLAETKSTR